MEAKKAGYNDQLSRKKKNAHHRRSAPCCATKFFLTVSVVRAKERVKVRLGAELLVVWQARRQRSRPADHLYTYRYNNLTWIFTCQKQTLCILQ